MKRVCTSLEPPATAASSLARSSFDSVSAARAAAMSPARLRATDSRFAASTARSSSSIVSEDDVGAAFGGEAPAAFAAAASPLPPSSARPVPSSPPAYAASSSDMTSSILSRVTCLSAEDSSNMLRCRLCLPFFFAASTSRAVIRGGDAAPPSPSSSPPRSSTGDAVRPNRAAPRPNRRSSSPFSVDDDGVRSGHDAVRTSRGVTPSSPTPAPRRSDGAIKPTLLALIVDVSPLSGASGEATRTGDGENPASPRSIARVSSFGTYGACSSAYAGLSGE
mmetsp:Transcript_10014/g.40445  ORF Transcript_10014/g.40445 Transcript_10014/m.40445 type:complete len:278 (+) Transcript_10014:2944-3777(+)